MLSFILKLFVSLGLIYLFPDSLIQLIVIRCLLCVELMPGIEDTSGRRHTYNLFSQPLQSNFILAVPVLY